MRRNLVFWISKKLQPTLPARQMQKPQEGCMTNSVDKADKSTRMSAATSLSSTACRMSDRTSCYMALALCKMHVHIYIHIHTYIYNKKYVIVGTAISICGEEVTLQKLHGSKTLSTFQQTISICDLLTMHDRCS